MAALLRQIIAIYDFLDEWDREKDLLTTTIDKLEVSFFDVNLSTDFEIFYFFIKEEKIDSKNLAKNRYFRVYVFFVAAADKIEVLEAEIEGFSQFQEVLQRENDELIFQNKALKSKSPSKDWAPHLEDSCRQKRVWIQAEIEKQGSATGKTGAKVQRAINPRDSLIKLSY